MQCMDSFLSSKQSQVRGLFEALASDPPDAHLSATIESCRQFRLPISAVGTADLFGKRRAAVE